MKLEVTGRQFSNAVSKPQIEEALARKRLVLGCYQDNCV